VKAEVAYPRLLAAVRAVTRYTTGHAPLLHLYASRDTLTLAAGAAEETVQVDLPGALAEGRVALPAGTLLTALTAGKPTGRAGRAATVTLQAAPGRLQLSVTGGPAGPVSLDTETPTHDPATPLAAEPAAAVAAGPVGAWCELLGGVAWAAGRDRAQPALAVVRLVREPGAVLRVEATDSYRIHRGCWGEPAYPAVDALVPATAAGRGISVLTGCDPAGQLAVYATADRVVWRTGLVRVCARTRPGPYPNLEAVREQVLADADIGFTVDRAAALAALEVAARIAAATGGRVGIDPRPADRAAEVRVEGQSAAPAWRALVGLAEAAGPVYPLRFNPRYARQAFSFLAGASVSVAAVTGRRAVLLHSADRHAVVMQLGPTAVGQAAVNADPTTATPSRPRP
jgi:hypothetical protein